MNRRIKELYLHAFPPSLNDSTVCQMSAERFAELIIRECIEVVGDCSDQFATRSQITEEIKEHFGVEL